MIDEAPAPNDSLGSLFDCGAWLYPRVWIGFTLVFASTLLPAELISIVVARIMGLDGPEALAQAARAGAFGRIGVFFVMKILFFTALLFNHWSCLAVADEVARGGELTLVEALSRGLRRLPAQLWTVIGLSLRLSPLGFAGGLAVVLSLRDSPLTAVFAIAITAIPYVYFTLRWILSTAVVQFEGVSGGAALQRSSALTGPRFWLVSFQFAVYTLAGTVPALVVTFASAKFLPGWAAGLPGLIFGALVVGPFTTGMFLALYRRESARAAAAAA